MPKGIKGLFQERSQSVPNRSSSWFGDRMLPGSTLSGYSKRSDNEEQQQLYPRVDVHAVYELARPDSKWQVRLFWAFVLVICVVSAAYACYTVISEYSKHPTATQLELKTEQSLELPQVYICAQSAYGFPKIPLWRYLWKNFPTHSNRSLEDLIRYIVGGSGFMKAGVLLYGLKDSKVKGRSVNLTDEMYRKLRGDRTVLEFFNYFFDTYGYSCKDMFHSCHLGEKKLQCCDHFELRYTIRRGRCFVLKKLRQIEPDLIGRLVLNLKLPELFLLGDEINNKLVIFINDRYTDIAPFPRFYVKQNFFTFMQLRARKLILLNEQNDTRKCAPAPYGRGTCYTNEMVLEKPLHQKHNCLLPYWPREDTARWAKMSACEPKVLVENYGETVDGSRRMVEGAPPCVFPCTRWEYQVTFKDQDASNTPFSGFDVELNLAYMGLEFEQVQEVVTVTFWKLVAQVGGQFGLFLGASLISLVELAVFGLLYAKRRWIHGAPRRASSIPDAKMSYQDSLEAIRHPPAVVE